MKGARRGLEGGLKEARRGLEGGLKEALRGLGGLQAFRPSAVLPPEDPFKTP